MSNTINSAAYAGSIPIAAFYWIADLGACGHYRCVQPAKVLARKHGAQVEVGSGSNLPYTVLVAQRTHKAEAVDFLQHVRDSRQSVNGVDVPKIMYELDDDLWSIEKDNPGYDYYTGNNVHDNSIRALAIADGATVSTEPLAEIVRKYNDNVTVVPNSVPRKYLNELRYPYTLGSIDKPFVMGWSGSATHLNDFRQCAASVNTMLKFNPNTRMVFFGTDYSHLLDPAVRGQVRQAPWTGTVSGYLELLSKAQIDVMLAPLTPSKFNESKSNLRLIEANALGIPVIATDWGPYAADRSPGVSYVGVGESWISKLSELAEAKMVRLGMSSAGRSWVEKNYCQEDTIDLWLEAYRAVIEA